MSQTTVVKSFADLPQLLSIDDLPPGPDEASEEPAPAPAIPDGTIELVAESDASFDLGDLLAELERRAGGGGGLPAQMLKFLQDLTAACARAGFEWGGLGPGEEEALAQIDELPAPFPAFAAFLRQIGRGELAPIPGGLPWELHGWLEEVVRRIREGS